MFQAICEGLVMQPILEYKRKCETVSKYSYFYFFMSDIFLYSYNSILPGL